MKAQADLETMPGLTSEGPGKNADLYLEIESLGHDQSCRLPVTVKDLSTEGVILETVALPAEWQGESLLQREGFIHMVPEGLSKEIILRSKVVWLQQGENGSSHYLLGLEFKEVDFRARRSLETLMARPKDMADLWSHWDEAQPQPVASDGRLIFGAGAGAFLGGVALHLVLPDSYSALATIMIFFGIYLVVGKCLWNWWRRRKPQKI